MLTAACNIVRRHVVNFARYSHRALFVFFEGPLLVPVNVVRRRCNGCTIKPWASDDWRSTGVFNCDNFLLLELRLVYLCLEAFVGITLTIYGSCASCDARGE